MKQILTFTILIFNLHLVTGQCTNSTQWPPSTVSASIFNDTTFTAPNTYAGDYAVIDNLLSGETYVFTSSSPSDYITLRNAYDDAILIAHGPAPLSYVASTEDILAVHFNLTSPSCGTENVFRTTGVVCTTCPDIPPVVGVNTSTPGATLDVGGEIKLGNSGRSPEAGMIRWNEDKNDFEGYNGEKWVSLTQSEGSWGKPGFQQFNENQNTETNQWFGSPVAIDGNYAVVGNICTAPFFCSEQEKVSIFKYNGNEWVLHDEVSIDNEDRAFGNDVDISGDYIVVGATYSDDVQGNAYVFKRTGSEWNLEATLSASDGDSDDFFGESVSIDGDIIAIGVPREDIGSQNEQGAVYTFVRNGSSWDFSQKITGSGSDEYDFFGYDVDISGVHMIVGAPFLESFSYDSGGAYIYERVGDIWQEEDEFTPVAGGTVSWVGRSVAINQNGDFVISDHATSNGNIRGKLNDFQFSIANPFLDDGVQPQFGLRLHMDDGIITAYSSRDIAVIDIDTKQIMARLKNTNDHACSSVAISYPHIISGSTTGNIYFYKQN